MGGSIMLFIGALLLYIVVIVFVGKLLVEWFFEIKKRNKYMEAQLRLTALIAAKHGVEESEIKREARLARITESNQ